MKRGDAVTVAGRAELVENLRTACRLTAEDYRRIDERLSERIGDLCRRDRAYAPQPWEWVRLAWHAIGCDERDLRSCELDAIAAQVEAVCAFFWSDRGRGGVAS